MNTCWLIDRCFALTSFEDYCDRPTWLAGSGLNRSPRRYAKIDNNYAGLENILSILCALGDLLFKSLRRPTEQRRHTQNLLAGSMAVRLYSKPYCWVLKNIGNKALDHSRVGRRFFNRQSIDAAWSTQSLSVGCDMSMQHKAFRFDWVSFNTDLLEYLHDALLTGDATQLVMYVNSAINEFSDPYEGEPLPADWMHLLINPYDVQEVGDYALTRFYNPTEDCGIGDMWTAIDGSLNDIQRAALLGRSIGPETNRFDPGKMGSYVQSPDEVAHSRSVIQGLNDDRLATFADLIDHCVTTGHGMYVTF